MMWYGEHMNGWGWTFTGVGMVLFCGVVITGLVLLVRSFGDTNRSSRHEDEMTPAEILSLRFARGEITEEEFVSGLRLVKLPTPNNVVSRCRRLLAPFTTGAVGM